MAISEWVVDLDSHTLATASFGRTRVRHIGRVGLFDSLGAVPALSASALLLLDGRQHASGGDGLE